MKRVLFYLAAVCLLMSCVPEIGVQPQQEVHLAPELEGKPVLVHFSVPDIPVLLPTKATGDIGESTYLDPDKFFLVVCGSSQSIKYIRKAEYDPSQDEEVFIKDPLTGVVSSKKTTLHHFTVLLELSDARRTIHFLGNVDESQFVTGSSAAEVLPTLRSQM